MRAVELKISNVPLPNVADQKERFRRDAEQLRKLAEDISNTTNIQISRLIRPKIDQHRLDRYNVVCVINESDLGAFTAKINANVFDIGETKLNVLTTFKTGKTYGIAQRSTNKEDDAQLQHHLATAGAEE